MFIIWSTSHDTSYFDLGEYTEPCKKCSANDYVIEKDKATIKLFFFIPIFWVTSYTLICKQCGRRKGIKKKLALELVANAQKVASEAPAPSEVATASTKESDDLFPDYSEGNEAKEN